MAKIHHLSISHFRGIKKFEQTFNTDFACLIGRGDSGKSTILDAIAFVLSSTWNVPFYDNDFFECNLNTPIVIEATVKDIPRELLDQDKFGSYLRTLDPATNSIIDVIEDNEKPVITIRLEVKKDLEPIWTVITNREVGSKPISASERGRLNTFLVADYLDRHFSWNKGSPLHTLFLRNVTTDEDDSSMIDALREAKQMIDQGTFSRFTEVVNKIQANAASLGVNISKTKNTIDFKDIVIKDGKLSMHDEAIPFRLKGKGSKRLISMAIQSAIADAGGIILIDEIEQGLEPDRAQGLVSTIKRQHQGQVFITTHSRDVLVELSSADIFLMRRGANALHTFDPMMQGLLRRCPEAFFAKKVIVAEGKTEMGICRALNIYRVHQNLKSTALLGVRLTEGSGSECFKYCKLLAEAGFSTALFCDSDENNKTGKKEELHKLGVTVIDWEEKDHIERAVSKYLPFPAIMELLDLSSKIKHEEDTLSTIDEVKANQWASIKGFFGPGCPESQEIAVDSPALRAAIGTAANRQGWFKREDKGARLGTIIFKYFPGLDDTNFLKQQLTALSTWLDQ